MENLRKKIKSFTPIDQDVLDFLLQFYQKRQVKKGEHLLREGQYIRHFFYLDQGCVCYYILKNGQEQVLEFFSDNDIFTDLYNYVEEKPSNCNLRAMEDCTIYAISKEDIEKSFQASHQLERFGRLLVQDEFIKLSRRVAHVTNLSNEERYLRFVKNRPKLIQIIPQYLVASYLGVTPVGLSKIRKRISQQG